MKHLALLLMLAVGVQAATLSLTTTGAATNNVFAGSARVYNLVLANGSGSAVTVALFDSSSTNLTYSYGSYVSYSNYVGNVTNVYTTSTGVSITNVIPSVVLIATNTVAGVTNSLPKLATIVVPAGTTTQFTVPLTVNRGLTVTNSGAIAIMGQYQRDL